MPTATISSSGSEGDSIPGGPGTIAMMTKKRNDEFSIWVLNKGLSMLFIAVTGWTLLSTQQHAEKISGYDQRLQSLDEKVARLESSVDKLWDRVDQGFSDLRNQIKNK